MSASSTTAPAIRVEQLGFTFAGRDLPTLQDISFSLEAGTWTLVTGPTGSGKSTLLRALAGLIPNHTAGRMTGNVFTDAWGLQPPGVTRGAPVQLLLQSADDQLCTTTVAAEVAFGLENLALPPSEIAARVAESLARFGLAGMESRPTHQLSGGQKQRLLLAAVLAMRPRVLLLDEPLSQLDPVAAAELLAELDRLRGEGVCIVLVEHRLDEVLAHCDRLLVMDGGRLVADIKAKETWTVEAANVADSLREFATYQRERGTEVYHFPATTFRFPSAATPLWQDVAFTLHDGDRVAVVGPNGSGKSTLLNLIAQQKGDRSNLLTTFGLVMQNPDLMLFCDTVSEELTFGPEQLGFDTLTIIERTVAAARATSITDLFTEPPQALSQGQRLRTAVAATLALAPRVLLLDEPTTGQDQAHVARVLSSLCDAVTHPAGPLADVRAILFSTHDLRAVARYANRVLVLAEGRLLADYTPAALLHDDDMLARARLRRPSQLKFRHRQGLQSMSAEELIAEVQQ